MKELTNDHVSRGTMELQQEGAAVAARYGCDGNGGMFNKRFTINFEIDDRFVNRPAPLRPAI
jgi:hypothetical protein